MKFIKNKKAFTLIELIVVIAVVGILVLLGMPRFIGYKDKAELARIQHDVKVMEQEVGTVLINNDDVFDKWEDNSKAFNQLIQESRLFEKEGVAEKVESIDKVYKVIPEEYKDKINTKLKGTFYANNNGKVYYEHERPLLGIPIKPEEKEPVYSDEEIDDLVYNHNFIPIATADELNNVRLNEELTYGKGTKWEDEYTGGLDKKYIQVLNLNLSDYSEKEEGWSPIGTFTGTYDGGSYVIRRLEVKDEDKYYQGLFGLTDGATIRNVGLIDNKVTGSWDVGGLVGRAENGTTISNSYATGSVTGEDRVGGLVGYTSGGTIDNSYATGEVTGTGDNVGGLVGEISWGTTIDNSYATGDVSGTDDVGGLAGGSYSGSTISNSYATGSVTGIEEVGGLVGSSQGPISNSYAIGSVTGEDRLGGLVGYNYTTVSNSYATGEVTGSGYDVGGLVGHSRGPISNSYAIGSVTGEDNVGGLVGAAAEGTISNSYATGLVQDTGTYFGGEYEGDVGGLVGYDYGGSIEINNSYWNIETTGQEKSDGQVDSFGKTTEEMKSKDTYSGWDFVDVWKIDDGKGYPKLR